VVGNIVGCPDGISLERARKGVCGRHNAGLPDFLRRMRRERAHREEMRWL